MKNIISNLKKPETSKSHLTIAINFRSSKDNDKMSVIHSLSDNTEIMIDDETDKIINELFESLFSRYQIGLENEQKIVILSLIMSIDCITNFIK